MKEILEMKVFKIFEKLQKNKCLLKDNSLAGLKAIKESISKPLIYWDNNVSGSINLLKVMHQKKCRTILCSSSATVYGDLNQIPFDEYSILKPNNPYGETKLVVEKILDNLFNSTINKWRVGYLVL